MWVRKGGTILTSQPYASVLYSDFRDVICNFCYKEPLIQHRLLCESCSLVSYCSRVCMQEDAHLHDLECSLVADCEPSSTTCWLLLRVWLRYNSELSDGGPGGEHVPGRNKLRTFPDLLTHEQDIRHSKKMMEHISQHYSDFQMILPHDLMPDHAEFVRLYGRVIINNFELMTTTSEDESLGISLYLTPSIVDHSCEPNAWVEIRGRQLVLRSKVDREKVDMANVFISYIDSDEQSATTRRDHLSTHYFFQCQCQRCKKDHNET